MCRFIRESLRFADRGAPGYPVPAAPSRDVARTFGRNGGKSPHRKSEVVFVDPKGCTFTHQQRFRHGVDEHPHFGPCPWGTPGASAKGGSYAVFHMSKLDSAVGRDL